MYLLGYYFLRNKMKYQNALFLNLLYGFQKMRRIFVVLLCLCLIALLEAKKYDEKEKPEWAKKDIRDFTDADMER